MMGKSVKKKITQNIKIANNCDPNLENFKGKASSPITEISATSALPNKIHDNEATVEAIVEYSVA